MKIIMDCLLVFLSGFEFWQFVVIYEKGFWSCHLDFIPMVIAGVAAIGMAISGGLYAFLKAKISFRSRMVGVFTLAVGLAIFFVELIPAWFSGGHIYGHEPIEFVLFGELFLLGGIVIFGLINLGIDIAKKHGNKRL